MGTDSSCISLLVMYARRSRYARRRRYPARKRRTRVARSYSRKRTSRRRYGGGRRFKKRVLSIASRKSTIPCGVVGPTVSSMSHSTMLRWRSLLGVQPPYPTTRLSMLRRTVTRRKSSSSALKNASIHMPVFPFVWRRVVFWTHQRFEQFRTIEGLGGTRFRLGVTYGVSDLSAFDIQELMFKGSAGVDWDTTRPIDARLDTQRIRVVSDRKVNFNPNSEQGRYSLFKRWHPIRRKIIYDQQENGDDMTPNYWSTVSPTSSGNLYIVDFFGFPPGLGQGAAARLSIQSTVYWRVEVIKLRLLVRLCTLFPHCHPTSQRPHR